MKMTYHVQWEVDYDTDSAKPKRYKVGAQWIADSSISEEIHSLRDYCIKHGFSCDAFGEDGSEQLCIYANDYGTKKAVKAMYNKWKKERNVYRKLSKMVHYEYTAEWDYDEVEYK